MTDSKTATERLREMLDARGVEWSDGGYPLTNTTFKANGITWHAMFRDSGIELHCESVTPQQAIAATLGSGECECVLNEQEGTFHCSSCGTLLTYEVRIEWPSHKVTPITLPNFCPNCGKAVKR